MRSSIETYRQLTNNQQSSKLSMITYRQLTAGITHHIHWNWLTCLVYKVIWKM
jgi:hypothetical protein